MFSKLLPGTVIETQVTRNVADAIFEPIFLSGGLVLSQISQITGLEGYIIHNWVKRKYLSPPQKKKYTRRQLCRILNINILKDSFSLDQIANILGYINGELDDESDDLIDDSLLYAYFVDCVAELDINECICVDQIDTVIETIICDYEHSNCIAKNRLCVILRIMLTAYLSQQIKNMAMIQYHYLDYK